MYIPADLYEKDLLVFHNKIGYELLRVIRQESNYLGSLKFSYTMLVKLKKDTNKGEENVESFLRQEFPILLNAFKQATVKGKLVAEINKKRETIVGWVERGSVWIVDGILTVFLDFSRNDPIRGGSYIPLPHKLKAKQAIINIKNRDNACLRWALRAARFPVTINSDRPSQYPIEDGFDFTGISFPTPLHEIPKVEKLNNIVINVLGWKDGEVVIYHVSEMNGQGIPCTNVMLITKTDVHTGQQINHYCYIKRLSRLLREQHSKGHHTHFCVRCLQGFSSERVLVKHCSLCRGTAGRPTRVDMPEKGKNILCFTNFRRQMKVPFIIYADCESIIEKIDTCIPSTKKSSTTKTQIHKPCGFSFVVVRSDGAVFNPFFQKGKHCVQEFLSALLEAERRIREALTHKAPFQMDDKDWRDFHTATLCHICKKDLIRHNVQDEIQVWGPITGDYCGKVHRFTKAPGSRNSCYSEVSILLTQDDEGKYIIDKWRPRKSKPVDNGEENDSFYCSETLLRAQFRDAVRDHCHITGTFRGAAHNVCNRSYFRINPKKVIIPVVFHNLKGYDSHHLMQQIAEVDVNLSCIPNNMEKYISFSLGSLRFIDSFQFLLSSLDSLVSSNKPEDLEIIRQFESDPVKISLLLRKGIYPYEYMDSFERFEERHLPPKEAFYSKLKKEHIRHEDYEHAKRVWEAFECENLGTYHDLYLLTDTLLLADVFENFRKTCLKNYGLDSAHYYTSPGLSWDALLKHTSMKLELLTDYNMYLFIEKGIRGGISTEMRRYSKANNPYLNDFNPEQEISYIPYLDANNLYGWAMSQPLPVGKFAWMQNMLHTRG